MATLKELKEKSAAKRAELGKVFEEAKTEKDGKAGYDFRQVKCLGGDINQKEGVEKSIAVAEQVKAMNEELDDLCEQVEKLEAAEGAANDFASKARDVNRPPHPESGDEGKERKSLSYRQIAKAITAHATFQKWRDGGEGRITVDALLNEAKALMSTGAGFPPESTRTGTVVDIALRPPQIMDIMPQGNTGQAQIVFMRQTTRLQAAAETAEGAAKPEAEFVFEEDSEPVKEVSVFLPVTEIQLEDVPFIESLVEGQLREDINERLDRQVLVGDGVGQNFTGLLNTSGILTRGLAGGPAMDAIFRAGTDIRTGTARGIPSHVVLHPEDWADIRLTRTTDGVYIWGNPSESLPDRIWGWPVVQNEAIATERGLVGDFRMRNLGLFERRGIIAERGWINEQFRENRRSIRLSGRWAFVVFRPAAFVDIDLTPAS